MLPFNREMLALVAVVIVRRCDGTLSLRVAGSTQQKYGLSDCRIDVGDGDDRLMGFDRVLSGAFVASMIATLTDRTATRNLSTEHDGEVWVWDID